MRLTAGSLLISMPTSIHASVPTSLTTFPCQHFNFNPLTTAHLAAVGKTLIETSFHCKINTWTLSKTNAFEMDAERNVEFAVNTAQFVDVAARGLSLIHNWDEPKKAAADANQEIDDFTKSLLERTKNVQFRLLDGVALLSQEDEILLRLVNQCQDASSRLLESLESFKATADLKYRPVLVTEKPRDGHQADLRPLLDSIRKDLNENLAQHLWSSISQTIRELGAKNSRLSANRTKEIKDLATSTNQSFPQIKSRELTDRQKSDIWFQILTAVNDVTNYSTEQVIMSALQFWTMDRRKELISKEHENTFKWVLEQVPSEDSSQRPVNFADWLRKDESVFWISGKPGSGKSTLMKYIAENSETMDGLKEWSVDDKLVTASFYFWSSAKDPLQKSGTGLLRSILFQILRQCPDLIQHAFPEQWEGRQNQGVLQRFSRTESTTNEFLAAYQRIANLLSTTKTKFCFFIDGLDEYDGDPSDIIHLVDSLSKTSNLKTCISSRQWTEFETVFGGSNPWKLYVHELTENDMTNYVESLLGKAQRFSKMKKAGGEKDAQCLVRNIVEKAEGVFLWVFLVVRSLLDGLRDTDQIVDLQQRLNLIPNDLENYFDRMLLDIEDYMREQTAHAFEITLSAAEKLPLMCYWFVQKDTVDSITSMTVQPVSQETASERLEQMATRLDAYSQGLLKVHDHDPSSEELQEYEWLFDFRVDFLHRTVADFFQTAPVRKLLKKWSAPSFNVDTEICKASLATIKITSPTSAMFSEASRALSILHLFLSHAKPLQNSRTALLDDFISSLKAHDDTLDHLRAIILGPGNYWAFDSSFNFAILYHFISYDLGTYVLHHLIPTSPLDFPEPPSALLSGLFSHDPRVRSGLKFTLNLPTLTLLLQKGLDPNLPWGDRNISFWQQLLGSSYSKHLKGTLTQDDCDAIKCAIEAGANQEAKVEVFSGRKLGESKAIEILEKVLPKEQFVALGVKE
jgi:hypothetical protein